MVSLGNDSLLCCLIGAIILVSQQYYISTSRELSRLLGVCRAPVIQHFAESLSGSVSVRSFDQEKEFVNTNYNLSNDFSRIQFHIAGAMEWLSFRLDILSILTFAFSLIFLICMPYGIINPGIAGLAVTYGLKFDGIQTSFIWILCNLENKIISVERILQYSSIPSEPPLIVEDNRPDHSWPSKGEIDIVNIQVRYGLTMPFILRGLTCTFPGGKKTGIVGRTGSGKSTLIQTIFRIIDPAVGHIFIDGTDISTIGLHDLRSRLGIIPQEPIMFQGTLRNNLDPLDEHTDEEIWEVLHLTNPSSDSDDCFVIEIISTAMADESKKLENGTNQSDALTLQQSDHSGLVLVSKLLNGNNYGKWSRAMRIALKNKTGFVNGTIEAPTAKDSKFLAWERCNHMVLPWILNVVQPDIAESIIYAEFAFDVWNDLHDRFSQENDACILKFITNCGAPTRTSTFEGVKGLARREEEKERVMQFLMGLNDSFSIIHGSILLMNPLPDTRKVHALVQQHERQNETLDCCQLGEEIRKKELKLDSGVAENGENWSVGQRQLVCLGRVILKKSKILVLDEATASVDTSTDIIIQNTLRQQFSESTVITVAHRITSVIGSDLVLVLENGVIVELGSPKNLLANKSSLFAKLVSEYTTRSVSVLYKTKEVVNSTLPPPQAAGAASSASRRRRLLRKQPRRLLRKPPTPPPSQATDTARRLLCKPPAPPPPQATDAASSASNRRRLLRKPPVRHLHEERTGEEPSAAVIRACDRSFSAHEKLREGLTIAGWKKVMGIVGANNALGGGHIMSGKEGGCCREQQVLSGVRECCEDGCAENQSVKGFNWS
ncbi:hypothetical protein ZIOFF_022365 [Zingiber officinale]|uniref:Uncharacterized protein n=1 Tax=Zingiber officinale TaxID=94328 RepID=A0A8J5LMQ3_ZINOF|nr:hypothetical protein ZIOFF_022365 [Zingiber officinale]